MKRYEDRQAKLWTLPPHSDWRLTSDSSLIVEPRAEVTRYKLGYIMRVVNEERGTQ